MRVAAWMPAAQAVWRGSTKVGGEEEGEDVAKELGEEDEPGGAEADVACREAYDGVDLGDKEGISICGGKAREDREERERRESRG
jgi:hypothetical protein